MAGRATRSEFKTETLRFLHEPGVPFRNNLAERDRRMIKLRMKISGTFRSAQGAKDFATLRTALPAAKKQSEPHSGTHARAGLAARRLALLAGAQHPYCLIAPQHRDRA